MKKEIKNKWIAALRSEKYQQTQGVLHDREGFCCLGVLCDISGLDTWRDNDDGLGCYSFRDHFDELPPEMYMFSGLTVKDSSTLIKMNDVDEASFEKIATYIEKEL
jgi:hypothetical protein